MLAAMRATVGLLMAGVAASIAGCGASDEPPPSVCWPEGATPGGEVDLGTGSLAFEPLADGDPLIVVNGPQGGNHVLLHARVRNLEGGDPAERSTLPYTRFSLFRADGSQIAVASCGSQLAYSEPADDWLSLQYGRFVIVLQAAAAEIVDEEGRAVVEVVDCEGRYATDERTVRLVAEPEPEPEPEPDAGPS
jgi:hypothetical protein